MVRHFSSLAQAALLPVLLMLALLAFAAPGHAATLTVPAQYATIQAAVNAANDGDTVLLASGTYTGPGNVDIDFGGRNITIASQNGPASTIIDCGGSSTANHRAFYLHSGESSAALSGLTIQNGYENSGSLISFGGGIYIASSTVALSLTNCILTGNNAGSAASPANYGSGGGIYSAGTVSLTNCTVSGNNAFYTGGGGGLYNGGGKMTLTNCTLTGNAANYGDGGGVYNGYGTLTLTNCTLTGNSANAAYGGGGGVYRRDGPVTLINDILFGDTGGEMAQAVVASGGQTGSLVANYCDIQGGYPGTGNITAGPRFVSAPTNLHLQPGSLCIGAGTPTGAPATDKDGTARPNPPTIGAYEAVSDGSLSPTATTVTGSAASYVSGQKHTFTATVAFTYGGNPSGTVTFSDGGTILETAPLNGSGVATLTTTAPTAVGGHTIVAAFAGGGRVSGSQGTTTVTVTPHVTPIYVSPTGSDSNNGSLSTPKLTIQGAISASQDGDTVIVTNGSYTGPGNVDLDFGGLNITVTSLNGPSVTAIDCGGSSAANHCGFYFHSGETNAVISGLTFRNGYESNYGSGVYGAGVSVAAGCTVALANCVISSGITHLNTIGYGGGVDNAGTLTMTNCTVSGNTGDTDGGIANRGTLTMTGCAITGNSAMLTSYGNGGGIYSSGGTLTLTNCIVARNSAPQQGGGIYSAGTSQGGGTSGITYIGTTTLINCTFTGNTGGGFCIAGGALTVVNTILYGDTGSELTQNLGRPGQGLSVTYSDIRGGYAGTGNINADPLFVNAPTDLHLQFGSPCLGAGTPSGAPATDKDGTLRPTPPAIGAYEGTPLSRTATPGTAHVLWNKADGTAAVWGVPATGSLSFATYGPFPGWTAKAIAEGPDGHVRLLWTHTDGRMSLWNLADARPSDTCLLYGPYPGWTATALAVGPDNAAHLLWDNADGRVSLWNLSDPRPSDTCLLYGPYAGWSGTAIALGPDNHERLLWTSTGGQMSLWDLSLASPVNAALVYGPYTGWTSTALAVGPDNAAHLLWDNVDGRVSLWNLSDPRPSDTCLLYGPYAGWSGTAIALGANGQERLLWDNVSGQMSLWNLSDPQPASSCLVAGPYSGWMAQALSAGP